MNVLTAALGITRNLNMGADILENTEGYSEM
jgi:hypothetical protein